MRNNSVVILRSVLVRFYRTGDETAFERNRCRVLIDKEHNLNWTGETINPRTHTPTVVQGGGEGLRIIPRGGFRPIKAQENQFK